MKWKKETCCICNIATDKYAPRSTPIIFIILIILLYGGTYNLQYYATTLGFVQEAIHNYYLCDLMKINIAHTMQSAYNEKGRALVVRR